MHRHTQRHIHILFEMEFTQTGQLKEKDKDRHIYRHRDIQRQTETVTQRDTNALHKNCNGPCPSSSLYFHWTIKRHIQTQIKTDTDTDSDTYTDIYQQGQAKTLTHPHTEHMTIVNRFCVSVTDGARRP